MLYCPYMFAEACFAEKLTLPEDQLAFEVAAATRLPVPFPKKTKADPYAGLNLLMDRKGRSGEALPARMSLSPSLIRSGESRLPIGDHLMYQRNILVYH